MTRESLKESIEQHFGTIPDQRVVTRSSHKLVDIIAIATLGILCGADGWVAIETYAKANTRAFPCACRRTALSCHRQLR